MTAPVICSDALGVAAGMTLFSARCLALRAASLLTRNNNANIW